MLNGLMRSLLHCYENPKNELLALPSFDKCG